jgi:transcriptional regulator with XRE-family HTH domain
MITNTVTQWRTAKGVSKAHMARQIRVKRSYMTKLEQGILQPSGEMMFRIAEYLDQPLGVVFQHTAAIKTHPLFSESKRCLTGNLISPMRPRLHRENKQTTTETTTNKA